MDAVTRRQAELAERVHNFALAYPSTDAAYASIVERVGTASARARALADAHIEGVEQGRVMTAKLAEVRRLLTRELLPHVGRVARAAMAAGTDLGAAYVIPDRKIPQLSLGGVARTVLDAATQDEAVLKQYGLSDTLLPRLTAAVQRYEKLTVERDAVRRGHVGARAGLKTVMREVRTATELLDSFNRLRFAPQSKESAEWTRTKTLLGARRTPPAPPAKEDDVRPAA